MLTWATWHIQSKLWDRVFKAVDQPTRMEMLTKERYSIKTRRRTGE